MYNLRYFRNAVSKSSQSRTIYYQISVKRALLSVKGSHKFETERQKQTLSTVNQAFCQLARGVRLPATFLTPRILVFVAGVSGASARFAEPVGWKRQGWCSVLGSLPDGDL